MKIKRISAWLVLSLALVVTAACGNTNNNSGASAGSSAPASSESAAVSSTPASGGEASADPFAQPVKLVLWHPDPDYAKKTYGSATEKFPNLTLEYIGGTIADAVAAGTVPDLIFAGSPADISGLQQLDLLMPLDDLISSHGFDLSTIRRNFVDFYRSYGGDGKLYMLPHNYATWGLYYNKKIFDRFGVDYPKNGMTWDQVIDLAAKLTKTEDGVQYIGLHPGPIQKMISQTGFGYVDPATDTPIFSGSAEMKKIVELLKRIIEIPGNLPADKPYDWFMAHQWSGGGDFVSAQNMAMHVTWNNVGPYKQIAADTGLDWDVVSWPLIGDGFPAVDPEPTGDSFGISKHTANPDAAMEVLKYFGSEEYQMINVKLTGKAPSLDMGSLNDLFIQQAPDKNLSAYLTNPPAGSNLKTHSPFERATWAAVDKGIESLINGEDTNTALAKMQEAAELIVQEAKKTQ